METTYQMSQSETPSFGPQTINMLFRAMDKAMDLLSGSKRGLLRATVDHGGRFGHSNPRSEHGYP